MDEAIADWGELVTTDFDHLRWGVLGTGAQAAAFVQALRECEQQVVVAVGSQEPGQATSFARALGIHRAYAGYEGVVDDPVVDALFVAGADEPGHQAVALARASGKPVLMADDDATDLPGQIDSLALTRVGPPDACPDI
jgi:Oxidoreductase family, NAD-binding Rossmann fold